MANSLFDSKPKAVVMPAGSSYTFSDHTVTLYFDPLIVLSSPRNALTWFSVVLSGINPVPAAVVAAQLMAQYALRRVTAGDCVRFGIFLLAFLETVYVIPPEVGRRPLTPPAVRAAVDALDEMLTDQMYRNFENSWGPTVGSGLSKDEVAALEKQKFAGKEEEEAPSCSVCLEEYKEGDVITPLLSSCSHKFHNACISKYRRPSSSQIEQDRERDGDGDAENPTSPENFARTTLQCLARNPRSHFHCLCDEICLIDCEIAGNASLSSAGITGNRRL